MGEQVQAIRCDHDGLKMAEVQGGHLVLRTRHHGETHVKIVALAELEDARRNEDFARSPKGEGREP